MKRIVVVLVSIGLLALSLATAEAGPEPLRTGTIESGTGVNFAGDEPLGERLGCEYAVDCRAWLQSGCNPALAGHDPALTASIVEVSALADGRTHRALGWSAPAKVHPGVMIQFWRQDCTDFPDAEWHSVESRSTTCESRPGWPDGRNRCRPLRIPHGARWMTVSAYWTTSHLTWTLT